MPAAQLAWIAEKFKEWTAPARELPEEAVDLDQALIDVSIYWFTRTAASAARLHKEGQKGWGAAAEYSALPHGVAVFPGDAGVRRIAEREHNVVHWSEFDRGGHFAAMEAPTCSSRTSGPSSAPSGELLTPAPARGPGGAVVRCDVARPGMGRITGKD
ncbi:hypothetical protein [Microbispora sp. H13382]|uniref:hypothetical protein n=1 Tax=Microbispora sp. H13382 TaxID=2729112 RepID=UPI001C721706|nr:hypothetical protein [Microbispora sp. H13382]